MKRMSVKKVSSAYAVILTLTLYLSLIMGFALPAPVQQIGSALLLVLTLSAGVLTSCLLYTSLLRTVFRAGGQGEYLIAGLYFRQQRSFLFAK